MVLKVNRYTLKVLKCGAGEGWMDSARNEELYRAKEGRNILHKKLLNLRIIREAQTGNLWRSVGR